MNDEHMIRILESNILPEIQRPAWLTGGALDARIRVQDLLHDSVFYPASGLDSDPLRLLGHHFWSFIYADYGLGPESVQSALGADKFGGYRLLGQWSVTEDELPLARWNSESAGYLEGGNNIEARERATPPFAEWALLERDYGPDMPQELMSLLFVGADGVTLFQKLYLQNGAAPACVAIIQPGDGMGDQNWTNFKDPNAYLAQAILKNPAGSPRFLLFGGNGRAEWYKEACWPSYDRCLAWPLARDEPPSAVHPFGRPREGAMSLWERTA